MPWSLLCNVVSVTCALSRAPLLGDQPLWRWGFMDKNEACPIRKKTVRKCGKQDGAEIEAKQGWGFR